MYLKSVEQSSPLFFSLLTEDESTGLYGFLNVIVHSASGLKQSLSMCFFPPFLFLCAYQSSCIHLLNLS